MQKRRSHKKSRNGCQNCKKWHTKCDEKGPSCNNCTLRKAKCVYVRPKPDIASNAGALTIRPKDRDSTAYPFTIERPRGDVGAICAAYGGPRRLLELELMHQWSTTTYKSFCGIPEDGEYLQVTLPRCALNYDFMLNCILAVSSLQIARSVGEANAPKYVNAALEFYNRGSSSFRTHLGSMNAENCHVLYMFSAIAVVVHLTIPQRATSVLELVTVAFDLLQGSTSIGMMGMPWIINSPFPIRLFIERMGASKDLIDLDSRAALTKLALINDELHKSTSEPINDNEEEKTGVVIVRDHELYQMVIAGLELCYAEEARGVLKGFVSAFPGLAGKHFNSRFSNSEPFSLLIIMHWAVLLARGVGTFWWASSIAEPLALEITDFLRISHPDLALEWEDSIAWALDRLGLPTPQSRELSFSSDSVGDSWGLTI
ncbi:hypothetical protein F4677DRAFT_436622 [Hypoxylon crocopeplum]|nr:hypothetical protein F4677DRAFT_436622 [Hypoxylon crocopeplum]